MIVITILIAITITIATKVTITTKVMIALTVLTAKTVTIVWTTTAAPIAIVGFLLQDKLKKTYGLRIACLDDSDGGKQLNGRKFLVQRNLRL